MVGKLRNYSWGALIGLAATGAAAVLDSALRQKPWLDAPLAVLCIAGGMLLERSTRYFVGRDLSLRLDHWNARREARRELAKLRQYEKDGVITRVEARDLAARIGKRDVIGGTRQGKPRGPYKKKSAARQLPPEPADSPPLPSPPAEPPPA